MERRALIATLLMILVLLGWQYFLASQQSPLPPEGASQTAPQPAPSPATPSPSLDKLNRFVVTEASEVAGEEVVVETRLLRAVFSTKGAVVKSWQLKRYKLEDGRAVEMVPPKGSPIVTLATWIEPGELVLPIYHVDKGYLTLLSPEEEGSLTFTYMTPSGLRIEKTFRFTGDSYKVTVNLKVANLGKETLTFTPQLTWGPGFRGEEGNRRSLLFPPTIWMDGKRVKEKVEKLQRLAVHEGTIGWAALHDTYFAAALVPLDPKSAAFVTKDQNGYPIVGLLGRPQTLPPGGQSEAVFASYIGPKELDRLKPLGYHLDALVDFGVFDFLARPALAFMKFLYRFTGNYGIAIIILTILLKILFHPLTRKSVKAMRAMQALQPKLAALRERYKNNPQKLNQETMELYKRQGVNPFGGCLPMLLQIPIFIALYNALSGAVELWRAPLDGYWIKDLSAADRFHILPILMGVSMFIQQKLSPPAGDPRQAQLMLYLMPVLFTIMFWNFPSGLVLYWFVNNLLQITEQTLILRWSLPPQVGKGKNG